MYISTEEIIIHRPDDWHLHLRDHNLLQTVLPFTSRIFARAVIMPNLLPPITSIKSAINYRKRIIAVLPTKHCFQPLMTCYITEDLIPKELIVGFKEMVFVAAKLYLAKSTTNSNYGIKDLKKILPILEEMQKFGMPLLIHGEISNAQVDIFDREVRFIEDILEPLREYFPELKMILEHISTKEAAQYVLEGDRYIAATITPQHLMLNRNHMLVNGLNPHLYCLPVLNRAIDQQALREVIKTGCDRFFIGTDSAPHLKRHKEGKIGCAGIFNAPTALSAYTTVFEEMNALPYLESFCAINGPRYYGLPLNEDTIKLVRSPWTVPNKIKVDNRDQLVPFLAGKNLNWAVITNDT
ncbi:MAG: dihydroorotase [Candidatus Dasytiphilus stammeri]